MCQVYSFIHSIELKIVWFYYVTVIWWSELKIHSQQGQIEELGLKANVEFKIQTINFGGIVHHMDWNTFSQLAKQSPCVVDSG